MWLAAFIVGISSLQVVTVTSASPTGDVIPSSVGTAFSKAPVYFKGAQEVPVSCTKTPCGHQPMAVQEAVRPPLLGKPNAQLKVELDSECSLWNSSCTGNRTKAAEDFFQFGGTRDWLINGPNGTNSWDISKNFTTDDTLCFRENTNCTSELSSRYAEIKRWMRTVECQMILDKLGRSRPYIYDRDNNCCGTCQITAGNVDVYFWPEPGSDTSCLSIIGDAIYPVDYGATTRTMSEGSSTSIHTYWGCTTTVTSQGSISVSTIETATLDTRDGAVGITAKIYLIDPYRSQPCEDNTMLPTSLTSLSKMSNLQPSYYVTARSLTIPSSGLWSNGTKVTTIVSGSFTL